MDHHRGIKPRLLDLIRLNTLPVELMVEKNHLNKLTTYEVIKINIPTNIITTNIFPEYITIRR